MLELLIFGAIAMAFVVIVPVLLVKAFFGLLIGLIALPFKLLAGVLKLGGALLGGLLGLVGALLGGVAVLVCFVICLPLLLLAVPLIPLVILGAACFLVLKAGLAILF